MNASASHVRGTSVSFMPSSHDRDLLTFDASLFFLSHGKGMIMPPMKIALLLLLFATIPFAACSDNDAVQAVGDDPQDHADGDEDEEFVNEISLDGDVSEREDALTERDDASEESEDFSEDALEGWDEVEEALEFDETEVDMPEFESEEETEQQTGETEESEDAPDIDGDEDAFEVEVEFELEPEIELEPEFEAEFEEEEASGIAPSFDTFTYGPLEVQAATVVNYSAILQDPDSSEISVSIDFEGDEVYDQTLPAESIFGDAYRVSFTHSYPTLGAWIPKIKATDELGLISEKVGDATIRYPGPIPPIIFQFQASPTNLPLHESVDFVIYVRDEDSNFITCSIDHDGDGQYGEAANAVFQSDSVFRARFTAHYDTSGDFQPSVLCHDEDDLETTEPFHGVISVAPPIAPRIGSFTYEPVNVSVGEPITFTIQVSDTDSPSLWCGIDMENDGRLDATQNATLISEGAGLYEAIIQSAYAQQGRFRPLVHCEDDDGASDRMTGAVSITVQ